MICHIYGYCTPYGNCTVFLSIILVQYTKKNGWLDWLLYYFILIVILIIRLKSYYDSVMNVEERLTG